MLIVPLHKRITADNFPWVTLALILANTFVFFFLQWGDDAVAERAARFYRTSGLVEVELPRYVAWASGKPERAEIAQVLPRVPEPMRSRILVQAVESDDEFRAALDADPPYPEDATARAQWRESRVRVDSIWAEAFTERWIMRYKSFDPARMTSAMFLHGGFGHLLGNMVFLAILGLLVEGALGPALFLGVYLLAGFGGATVSLLRHYGEPGALLGASGAIAGLMGAYCVLWGLRKVRFFYWFFVVFNYVRAPALVLLPAWLGWELASLWLFPDAHVAFDVHAGGIVAGALLASAVRWRGLERRAFLDEEERQERKSDALVAATAALGKLEFARARIALEPLVRERPDDAAVLLPWFRAWRDKPQDPGYHAAARALLLHPSARREDLAVAREAFGEYCTAVGARSAFDAADRIKLARRWLAGGALAEAERTLMLQPEVAADAETLAETWLALARAQRERGEAAAAERVLRVLLARYPAAPAAAKAKFLLEQPA